MTLRVGIRADASPQIGGGHVMRCLALAGELRRRGADVIFFSAGGSDVTAPALARSGFQIALPSSLDAISNGPMLDAIVVDHYELSAADETGFRRMAKAVAVVDDLADRAHDCDLLVDTTWGLDPLSYADLAPTARYFLGPQFALQRPAFAALRPGSLVRLSAARALRRVLVSFGLTDPGGVTAPAAETLLSMPEDLSVDVVVKKGSSAWKRLEPLTTGRLTLLDDPPELADIMVRADLVVGAGGITSWERCSLGLPAVVAQMADNQARNVAALSQAGAALILEEPLDMEDGLRRAMRRVFDPGVRSAMSKAASLLSDGLGASRVADALVELAAGHASLRRLT